MFRLNYTNLNKKQVEAVLAKSSAPACASEFDVCLSGKTIKVVLDEFPVKGSVLEYAFQSATKLKLSENGAAAVECGYGAHTLENLTLFSHMIPGTKRGYNVIINWKTSVVTVFEMWFIDHEGTVIDTAERFVDMAEVSEMEPFVNREVQRQYYFGYLEEEGKTPPENRDKLSLYHENSVIKWKEDRGKKRLFTYAAALFTTVVDLDTPDGGDMLTFASDLLQIDNRFYIHSFCEVEFSGRLSVEVFDLFTMQKIGVTMGIDENDNFEHTLYKGRGKYLGRFPAFHDFNDRGDKLPNSVMRRSDYTVKGARATYRPSIMAKAMSEEEIAEASKNLLIFDPIRAKNGIMQTNVLPDTDYCACKTITFRGDSGLSIEMRINSISELEYRIEGEEDWKTEQYRAMELDKDLIILGFYRSGSCPSKGFVFALDFINGCATCIALKLGTKHSTRDVDPDYHFGVIETEGVSPVRMFRHGFTNELLGRAFAWIYGDSLSSIHTYNAPHSYSWTIITNDEPGSPANRAGGYVWSSPCEYIKLRDDVYIMSFVEQKWDGITDIFCMNLRIMRDVGFEFGLSLDGKSFHMDKVGAIGRSAGQVDLSNVYTMENYNPKA